MTAHRFALLCIALAAPAAWSAEFRSSWPRNAERVWAGSEYWANPLQDWRIAGGRLECYRSGVNRNVNLLTHQLGSAPGAFELRVRLGRLPDDNSNPEGWAGFRIGIRGQLNDHRDSALRGRGIDAGVTTAGRLVIGKPGAEPAGPALALDDLELALEGRPAAGGYQLTLRALGAGGKPLAVRQQTVPGDLAGNLALVSSGGAPGDPAAQNSYQRADRGRGPRFWFADWRASGAKLEAHPGQAFGPILFAQHTLGKGVMKMTAQMPPLAAADSDLVRLQTRDASGAWKTIEEERIHTLARTATFRIPGWDESRDTPYRLAYTLDGKEHYWEGTVRRDPADKETIVVAGFTGNMDTGFPNTHTVRNVRLHNPDVLVFTGDQIYEQVAGFGIETEPVEIAALDYLRKWYLLGWAWGDLMRDRVTVSMPDDHDVYHGNIWGAGGRKTTLKDHARGGYRMPAEWVRMVERTQASHLPDPYDPRPIEQGIGVYYTELRYGRISFAILEDRKFKSGPQGLVPPTGGRPDHVTDPNFDRRAYDPPGARLFGERQHRFIRDWVADWRESDMKVSLTQTILANAATTHGAEMMRLVADLDSNGWPASARNAALRDLRRGFVFMIGGDQHLASIIHHGADDWEDSGYSFCVPSINAGYPRAFWPDKQGENRAPGAPEATGRFLDGFGNRMTIHAVGNPEKKQRKTPLELLHDKASGYGLVRLHKPSGKITIECWRFLSDPRKPEGGQFPGFPMTIRMEDNYGRRAVAWLPEIRVTGMENPVVQVVDEADGELVYALRIRGRTFRPKIFRQGTYTVRVGAPETGNVKTFSKVSAGPSGGVLNVAF